MLFREVRACRFTTGFTKHGGYLHVYMRQSPQKLQELATGVFKQAARRFCELAEEEECKSLAIWAFDGASYGPEYIDLGMGDAVRSLPTPAGIDGEGWAFGVNVRSGHRGWFPPDFVRASAER